MKKTLLSITLCLTLFCPQNANAEHISASITINADTREVLFGENYTTPLPIASTTKIMTAIIAIENASPKDVFTVSEKAQNQEGSSVYLRKGENITVHELLLALMLNSGNDAAMVIAENVGGSEENFVSMMNEKAKELGCKNTNFENPSGLPSDRHFSTAYDMAIIMAYAMQSDFFMEIVSQKEYQIKTESTTTYLKNHNKLLWQYPYCIGGKTGYTKDAGRCLVSCSEKDGKRIVCVTLNQHDDWQVHMENSEKAFEKVKKIKLFEKYEIITTKKINGVPVNLLSGDDVSIFMASRNKRHLICRILLDENINQDITAGEKIGVAHIYYKKFHIATLDLFSGRNIKSAPKNIFKENFNYIMRKMLPTIK